MVGFAVVATACSGGTSAPAANDRPHPVASRPTSHPAAGPHPASPAASTFTPTQPLVSAVHWVHYPEGWRIEVMPSIYGRNHSPQAVGETLAEALRLEPLPLHLTHSMRRSLYNQLRCHADFAPRKPSWDLESWRPNVGYFQTVEALCNPGGGF